jgi:transcriptional regulator with XRE-family HTH domain
MQAVACGLTFHSMPLKYELSSLVSRRLEEIGLTRTHLAELARVSPDAVEELLSASNRTISVADAEHIANAVGLSLGVFGHIRSRADDPQAFHFAAQSASTSFSEVMPGDLVRGVMITGQVPTEYRAHIRIMLDEASVAVLGRLADQVFRESGISQKTTWQVMRKVAIQLACAHPIWQ